MVPFRGDSVENLTSRVFSSLSRRILDFFVGQPSVPLGIARSFFPMFFCPLFLSEFFRLGSIYFPPFFFSHFSSFVVASRRIPCTFFSLFPSLLRHNMARLTLLPHVFPFLFSRFSLRQPAPSPPSSPSGFLYAPPPHIPQTLGSFFQIIIPPFHHKLLFSPILQDLPSVPFLPVSLPLVSRILFPACLPRFVVH